MATDQKKASRSKIQTRKHIGGTAPEQVRAAVARARIGLGQG